MANKHILDVSVDVMQLATDNMDKGMSLRMRIPVEEGDLVEFRCVDEHEWTRPYRTVEKVTRSTVFFSHEETFVEAIRRWRREEREEARLKRVAS